MQEYEIKAYNGEYRGAAVTDEGFRFGFAYPSSSHTILKLYDNNGKLIINVNMDEYRVNGRVHSVLIKGIKDKEISYVYVKDGEPVCDPFVKRMISRYRWGDFKRLVKPDRCMLYDPAYDWEGDTPLCRSYSETIGYMLHVRGFTKHSSSQVSKKGTFAGVTEKIPYLSELGITQVELMPAYDFDECELINDYRANPVNEDGTGKSARHRLNYWGFKKGRYFLPKPQYAYSQEPVREFKDMVKALHKAGIEVVLQFYFPDDVNRNLIIDCLRFWLEEYHIDGFHLYGNHLPLDVMATDPVLADSKLYYERYDAAAIFNNEQCCTNGFLAEFNSDYSVDIRRFLKSDEDMIHKFLYRSRSNPDKIKVINHITSYDGFTLNDLVSYDYKHNENNGEDNKDGTGYNYSWNCGIEGVTRKNAVQKLRLKQLKNAFAMLLLSQGPPMFMAGDEFMNSQNGNNNPYCQDNETTWLNWKMNRRSAELFGFVKELIRLRKEHPVLRMEKEASLMDVKSCGCPDISYHSENAWYPQMDTHIRHMGIMLCGLYAGEGKDNSFYIAFNMHWEEHRFALPKLKGDIDWEYCMDTDGSGPAHYGFEPDNNSNMCVRVLPRTILLLKSREAQKKTSGRKSKKGEGK